MKYLPAAASRSARLIAPALVCAALPLTAADAGVVLNLDASDTGSLMIDEGTGEVNAWTSTAGAELTFEPAASDNGMPIWRERALNGLPSVGFDGENDRLAAKLSDALAGSDTWTILTVCRTRDTSTGHQTVFANPNGFTGQGGGISLRLVSDNNGWAVRFRDGSGGESTDALELPAVDDDGNPNTKDRPGGRGEPAVRGVSADGEVLYGIYNQQTAPMYLKAGSKTTWTTKADVSIGGRGDDQRFFAGDIAQVLVFDEQLTEDALANVVAALARKWEIEGVEGGDADAGLEIIDGAAFAGDSAAGGDGGAGVSAAGEADDDAPFGTKASDSPAQADLDENEPE